MYKFNINFNIHNLQYQQSLKTFQNTLIEQLSTAESYEFKFQFLEFRQHLR